MLRNGIGVCISFGNGKGHVFVAHLKINAAGGIRSDKHKGFCVRTVCGYGIGDDFTVYNIKVNLRFTVTGTLAQQINRLACRVCGEDIAAKVDCQASVNLCKIGKS